MTTLALWAKILVVLLPLLSQLVILIRNNRLSVKEIEDAFKAKVDELVAIANDARANVDHSPSSVQDDEFNRD